MYWNLNMAFFLNMSCRKKTLFRTLSRSNNIFKSSQIQNLLVMLIEATMKMVLDKPAILALCHFHFVFYSQTVEGGGVPFIFQILIDILTWQILNGAFRLFNWPTNFNIILICVHFTHKDTFPDAYFQLFVQDSIH